MNRLSILCLIIALSLAGLIAQEPNGKPPEASPSPVSEIQRLKVENLQLKIQVAQLQATLADREAKLASATLSSERVALEADLLKTLKASPGDTIDWNTLTLKKPEPPPPPPVKK